jgi:hypothetical protein
VGMSGIRGQTLGGVNGVNGMISLNNSNQTNSFVPSQHILGSQPAANGARSGLGQNSPEPIAALFLIPLNGTFDRKTIQIPFYPDVLKIGRQTNQKTVPTTTNGYFDSKVLSRQHAEVYSDKQGKIWIRDIKSSNGTFINGHRLSLENRESDPHELHESDNLELGIDIIGDDQKSVLHHKVAARVEHAGFYTGPTNGVEINFGSLDPVNNNGLAQGPQTQMRGRNMGPTNGLNGRVNSAPPSVTGGPIGPMVPQSRTNFWIQPVTMEQIVKKLAVCLEYVRGTGYVTNMIIE